MLTPVLFSFFCWLSRLNNRKPYVAVSRLELLWKHLNVIYEGSEVLAHQSRATSIFSIFFPFNKILTFLFKEVKSEGFKELPKKKRKQEAKINILSSALSWEICLYHLLRKRPSQEVLQRHMLEETSAAVLVLKDALATARLSAHLRGDCW